MYDYIIRVVITLPLSVYEGTWTTLSLSLLCITMILRVRRKFLKLLRSPTPPYRPHSLGDGSRYRPERG